MQQGTSVERPTRRSGPGSGNTPAPGRTLPLARLSLFFTFLAQLVDALGQKAQVSDVAGGHPFPALSSGNALRRPDEVRQTLSGKHLRLRKSNNWLLIYLTSLALIPELFIPLELLQQNSAGLLAHRALRNFLLEFYARGRKILND